MFVVAYSLIELKANNYYESNPKLSRSDMNDYRHGAALGFVHNLIDSFAKEEEIFAKETGTALVPVDNRLVEAKDHYLAHNEKPRAVKEGSRNSEHTASGYKDGQKIRINEGVTTNGKKTQALTSK